MSKAIGKAKQKRVVSKAEYARVMARNALLTTIAVVCLAGGIASAIACAIFWLICWQEVYATLTVSYSVPILFGAFLGLTLCGVFAKWMVENVEEVRPMTRQVVAKLPAEEVLVRGAALPITMQKTVLLRAAQEKTETPQEQLLRAAE